MPPPKQLRAPSSVLRSQRSNAWLSLRECPHRWRPRAPQMEVVIHPDNNGISLNDDASTQAASGGKDASGGRGGATWGIWGWDFLSQLRRGRVDVRSQGVDGTRDSSNDDASTAAEGGLSTEDALALQDAEDSDPLNDPFQIDPLVALDSYDPALLTRSDTTEYGSTSEDTSEMPRGKEDATRDVRTGLLPTAQTQPQTQPSASLMLGAGAGALAGALMLGARLLSVRQLRNRCTSSRLAVRATHTPPRS